MADELPDPQAPLLLQRRLEHPPADPGPAPLRLALSAEERTRLRGRRHSLCGRALLLQLPRGRALEPGEWLAPEQGGAAVLVEAAEEALLVVRAPDPLALLQAAYHLGNRHVALELRQDELRLVEDPVLADLLIQRGLRVERRREPFLPEGGAYAAAGQPSPEHSHHDHPIHGQPIHGQTP